MDSRWPAAISGKLMLLLAAFGLLGALLVVVASSRYGLAVTPDSVIYISVARALLKGDGFVDFSGSPLVMFPPLYPALLALSAAVLGRDPVSSARILNALLFALIIFLSGVLCAGYLRWPRGYSILATVAVLVSVPLVPVQWMVLSDPVFICLVLLFFLFLNAYLQANSTRTLLLLSLSVSLACLARYVGVVLIAAGVLSILFFAEAGWRARLQRASLFAALSAVVPALWAARNFALSGTLFGPRSLSAHTYFDNLRATWNNVLSWYLPARALESPLLLVLIAAAIALAATLKLRKQRAGALTGLPVYGPLLLFVFIYVGFLVATSETGYTQIIDDRYLSPIFVPLTILILSAAAGLFGARSQAASGKLASGLLLAAMLVWLIYPATQTAQAAVRQLDRGSWFTSRSWRDSQTMRYLRDHTSLASECSIYSNAYDAIYLLTGMQARSIPVKSNGPVIIREASSLAGAWPPEGRACVVQFNEIDRRTYLFTPAELLSVTTLDQQLAFDDGTIYVLSRK